MSDEATVRSGMIIKVGNVDYSGKPTSYLMDVTSGVGPSPGFILATVLGVDVDLSALTLPALCRIHNFDAINFVEYGIWDPEGSTFYPFGELLPGTWIDFRLSRNIQEEFGTGTGTTGANTNRLRLKADTASCECAVEAFEN